MSTTEIILTILIAIIATVLTRAISFLLFSRKGKPPKIIQYLGVVLPAAVMGMLVVYSLKDVQIWQNPYGIPELLGVLITVGIHFWKHNMILSLAVGTITYMALVQTVFN